MSPRSTHAAAGGPVTVVLLTGAGRRDARTARADVARGGVLLGVGVAGGPLVKLARPDSAAEDPGGAARDVPRERR